MRTAATAQRDGERLLQAQDGPPATAKYRAAGRGSGWEDGRPAPAGPPRSGMAFGTGQTGPLSPRPASGSRISIGKRKPLKGKNRQSDRRHADRKRCSGGAGPRESRTAGAGKPGLPAWRTMRRSRAGLPAGQDLPHESCCPVSCRSGATG